MKLCITALLLFSASLVAGSLKAQERTSLHLKAGAASSLVIPSSATRGEVYRLAGNRMPLPVLAIEWRKPLVYKKEGYTLLTTFGLNPWRSTFVANEANMQGRNGIGLAAYDYTVQLSAAIEKKFQPKNKSAGKNYFSAFLGAGLAYNIIHGNQNPDNKDGILLVNWGTTKNGEFIQGSRFFRTNSNMFSPVAVGGLRYHILNRKGTEVLALELASRYAPGKLFDWGVRYQKNGVDQTDYLAEKGFNVQFTLVFKLATLGKNKE